MAGIAGIAGSGKETQVRKMVDRIAHRGSAGREILAVGGSTLGALWPRAQSRSQIVWRQEGTVRDAGGDGSMARAQAAGGQVVLTRGPFGVKPLYYGLADDKTLCFASEVKAVLEVTRDVHELPPGCCYDGHQMAVYSRVEKKPTTNKEPKHIAQELRLRLEVAVERHIAGDETGSWLSGGLDSSVMAALARQYVGRLHTFCIGTPGATDLQYARHVADFIQAHHHERVVHFDEMLAVLPEVIYHLESFDALLVRSSITNYLVGKLASDYVPAVFSGEGGDELFAGYEYLKSLDQSLLPDELVDLIRRLHNTALQRVDRCAAAHGIVAHIGFLDRDVVDYALRIPVDLKLQGGVEKLILRQAATGLLPDEVLHRTKAKFWEGAGVGELLAQYADERISDAEFEHGRKLRDGQVINSKEELMYYWIFCEHFGEFDDLSWMGRTKGVNQE